MAKNGLTFLGKMHAHNHFLHIVTEAMDRERNESSKIKSKFLSIINIHYANKATSGLTHRIGMEDV